MNYELAKRLKDAGFAQMPYKGDVYFGLSTPPVRISFEVIRNAHFDNGMQIPYVDYVTSIPALSELIEAVKAHPMNRKDVGLYCNGDKWVAWARKTYLDEGGDGERDCEAATPEEAVANIWLALNDKK